MKIKNKRRTHSCKDAVRSQCFSFDDFGIQCKVDFESSSRISRNKFLKKGFSDATDLKCDGAHSDIDFQVFLAEKEPPKIEELQLQDTATESKGPKARWHSFDRRSGPSKCIG